MIRATLFLALCFGFACANAEEQVLEVISLKHRPADAILPLLQPLMKRSESITGMNNQIVVRASPAHFFEIKRAIATLDIPLRRLRISVRQDIDTAERGHGHGVSGSLRAGEVTIVTPDGQGAYDGTVLSGRGAGAEIQYRSLSTNTHDDEKNLHFVQTVEGQSAFIQTGQAVPLPEATVAVTPYSASIHESIQYRDVNSGFYVVPRLNGDQVTLSIAPQHARMDPARGGIIEQQAVESTVTGRLGEWIALGGHTNNFANDTRVELTRTRRWESELRAIWVKVDEVP